MPFSLLDFFGNVRWSAIWAAKCEPTKTWTIMVNEVQAHALLGRFQPGETQGGSDTGTRPWWNHSRDQFVSHRIPWWTNMEGETRQCYIQDSCQIYMLILLCKIDFLIHSSGGGWWVVGWGMLGGRVVLACCACSFLADCRMQHGEFNCIVRYSIVVVQTIQNRDGICKV